jgi:hypothetical protein
MDNKAKYPRIVGGYKLTVNVDWEDGENEDIDISNIEIRERHGTLSAMMYDMEGLESERADALTLGCGKYIAFSLS